MAKRSLPRNPSKKSTGFNFFGGVIRPPKPTALAETAVKRMDGKDVLESIKGFGKGWKPAVAKAFAVPEHLNFMRNETTGDMLFSKEPEFNIADVVNSLSSGGLERPKTKYGIGVYEKASTMYIVLVDMKRRIVVRNLRMNLHDAQQYKDWGDFVNAVKEAERAAKANPGSVAVHDGTLRYL